MPAFEVRDLKDRAVLWPPASFDAYGEYAADPDDAEEIACRWVWGQSEAAGPGGTPVSTSATVVVARDIDIGAQLWQGRLKDLPANGLPPSDVMTVVDVQTTPDIKGRFVRRTLSLAWSKDVLNTE